MSTGLGNNQRRRRAMTNTGQLQQPVQQPEWQPEVNAFGAGLNQSVPNGPFAQPQPAAPLPSAGLPVAPSRTVTTAWDGGGRNLRPEELAGNAQPPQQTPFEQQLQGQGPLPFNALPQPVANTQPTWQPQAQPSQSVTTTAMPLQPQIDAGRAETSQADLAAPGRDLWQGLANQSANRAAVNWGQAAQADIEGQGAGFYYNRPGPNGAAEYFPNENAAPIAMTQPERQEEYLDQRNLAALSQQPGRPYAPDAMAASQTLAPPRAPWQPNVEMGPRSTTPEPQVHPLWGQQDTMQPVGASMASDSVSDTMEYDHYINMARTAGKMERAGTTAPEMPGWSGTRTGEARDATADAAHKANADQRVANRRASKRAKLGLASAPGKTKPTISDEERSQHAQRRQNVRAKKAGQPAWQQAMGERMQAGEMNDDDRQMVGGEKATHRFQDQQAAVAIMQAIVQGGGTSEDAKEAAKSMVPGWSGPAGADRDGAGIPAWAGSDPSGPNPVPASGDIQWARPEGSEGTVYIEDNDWALAADDAVPQGHLRRLDDGNYQVQGYPGTYRLKPTQWHGGGYMLEKVGATGKPETRTAGPSYKPPGFKIGGGSPVGRHGNIGTAGPSYKPPGFTS